MNYLAVLTCLSLLLAAAGAQEPKPCVVPGLMSGGLTVVAANGLVMSTGTVSYDAFNQRMRVRNYGVVGNQTFALDQMMLFTQKVYYEIDWSKLSCRKKALDTTFLPMQVPSDAKLISQAFVGSSSSWGMGVLVNTWTGDLPQSASCVTYASCLQTIFTETGCIPVTFTGYTPASGWTTVSTFNWVVGNSNPMDYIPPFFCAKSKLEEKPDTIFTALESLATKTKKEV